MATEGIMTRRRAADLAQNSRTPVSHQPDPHLGDGDIDRNAGNQFNGAKPKSSSILDNNEPSSHYFHAPQEEDQEYRPLPSSDMYQLSNQQAAEYGSHDHNYAYDPISTRIRSHELGAHRSRTPQREPRYRPVVETCDVSPSSDGEPEPRNGDPDLRNLVYAGRPRGYANNRPKMPVFYGDGKETWNVWFNRFNDIANRYGWGNSRKLDELLPCLQGTAGDFVYGQLPRSVRTNFPALIRELTNRFHRHETTKRFHAQFSNRSQKSNESVEEYAADLKRLYDKAHSARDPETRKEDLLRRFLDGLNDDHARFHVEFVKDPSNIDEAVYEVVNFIDTKKRSKTVDNSDGKPRKFVRQSHTLHCESDPETPESEDEIEHTARVSDSKDKSNTFSNYRKTTDFKPKDSSQLEEIKNMISEMTKGHADLQTRISKLELSLQKPHFSQNRSYQNPGNQNPRARQSRECFLCGKEGHFVRECPQRQDNPTDGPSSPSEN
jgi:hypothetical protein